MYGSLLSNWFFVGGVSTGTLVLSLVIGLLLAKAKIKKGFDVYEDQNDTLQRMRGAL